MISFILFLIVIFLKSIHIAEQLRWQTEMRAELEKAISEGKISQRKAKEIISHPQAYGITRHELDFDSFSRSEERSWIEQEAAQKGWHKLSTIFIIAILLGIFLAILIGLALLIVHWKRIYLLLAAYTILGIILGIVASVLLIFIGAYIIYPLVQMFKY
jgi:ABC-type multidrug transport system fused ATPase/permease subunit